MIGKLITQPGNYKAFVPEKFPNKKLVQDLLTKPKIIQKLSQANHLIGKLDGITEILPDIDFFIFMYVRKEAALSSQIEGTKATMADAIEADAEMFKGLPDDVDRIQKYIEAMNYGLTRVETLPLSLRLIREVHSTLLSDLEDSKHTPGEFRKTQNWIGGSNLSNAKFIPPPPTELMRVLGDIETFMIKEKSVPDLIKAGLMHAQFETAHPFLDGNGRTGRLLITFYLCQKDRLERPVLYLSAYFKKFREEYFDRLNTYHSKGDVEAWIDFFLDGIIETAKDAIQTSKTINSLYREDIIKIQKLGQSAEIGMGIWQNLFKLPIIDNKKIEEWTGYTRQGAYRLLKRLGEVGILEKRDESAEYGIKYVYKRYLNTFTHE